MLEGASAGESDVSRAKNLIAAFMLFAFAAPAAAQPAITDSKLNLRSGPGPAFGIIAVMPAGTKFDIERCGGDWCRVKAGRQVGYASKALLKTGADSYASVAPQPAPTPAVAAPQANLTGPHIWQWKNDDWRDDNWRRLQWHNRIGHR